MARVARQRTGGARRLGLKVPDVATSLADVVSGLIVKTPGGESSRQPGPRQPPPPARASLPPRSPAVRPRGVRQGSTGRRDPGPRIPPALHLTERRPPSRSFRYESDGMVLVSRVEQSSLPISDPDIGTRHALLSCQAFDWHVYDLFHPSGTFLNGRKVEGPAAGRAGDELRFGKHSFLVDLEFEGTGIIPRFDLLKRLHHGRGGDPHVRAVDAEVRARPGRSRCGSSLRSFRTRTTRSAASCGRSPTPGGSSTRTSSRCTAAG